MNTDPKTVVVICHDKDGNKQEVSAAELHWRPSIYGVIIQNDQILLTPCWDGWDFPGGGMDIHETLGQALIRETWEETGYTVEPQELLGCFDSFWTHPISGKHSHAILHYYRCRILKGEISGENLTDFEKQWGGKAQWIPLTQVHTLKFYNNADSLGLIAAAMKLGDEGCCGDGCCS